MEKREAKAKARVRVLLEIAVKDTWGGECSVDQVWKQTKDQVSNMLRRGLVVEFTTIQMPGQTMEDKTEAHILEVEPIALIYPSSDK